MIFRPPERYFEGAVVGLIILKADLLYVKRGRPLETFCLKEGIPFVPFDSFYDVTDHLRRLIHPEVQE